MRVHAASDMSWESVKEVDRQNGDRESRERDERSEVR